MCRFTIEDDKVVYKGPALGLYPPKVLHQDLWEWADEDITRPPPSFMLTDDIVVLLYHEVDPQVLCYITEGSVISEKEKRYWSFRLSPKRLVDAHLEKVRKYFEEY
jgi:hypothetical protein